MTHGAEAALQALALKTDCNGPHWKRITAVPPHECVAKAEGAP